MGILEGEFVEVRGRPWLVEAVDDTQPDLTTLRLSCIADDAQGEQIEVLWDAEIGARVLEDDAWSRVGRGAPDSPEVLAAYVKAIRWRSATAADRDLLQAPFRAGIRLDAYQLLPLRKALRLPRVNLLIADDVGLGKTVEAGLVARELLLRRRIDLIVISAPAWNPSRLEQRNGRIDRKLQPAKQVFCRYFLYEQREADIVLEALVRKTEVIQRQLGSAGQVIEKRIADRLAQGGIDHGAAAALAKAIEQETDAERLVRARAEMDDEERARYERVVGEQQELRDALERSRERVGVSPDDLQRVVGAALARAGLALEGARAKTVGDTATFRLDPNDPAFAKEPGWQDTFDDLRERPRRRGERIGEWRKRAPIRAIAFEPPRLPDGRNAPEVVQVHLEHRLVRRLLSRFLSQGFQAGLSRLSAIEGPGAQPRVVLMGRLAVYGAGAARLHEEIIPVTAIWTEAGRERKPLRPLGESGEERTLNQLEDALRHARAAPKMAVARIQALVERDIADLSPAFERIAEERLAAVTIQLAKRGETEAKLLSDLLETQRGRIAKASAEFDPNQLLLPGIADDERREREADRRHWQSRLSRLESEIRDEPERIRVSYTGSIAD